MRVAKIKNQAQKDSADWFRILNRLSRTINLASADVSGVLKSLTQELIREIKVGAVAVWVVDENGDFMKIEAAAGLSERYVRFFNRTDRIPVGKGMVGNVVSERTTISFERLEEYQDIGVSRWNQMLEEEGIAAILAAPMFVGKKIVGTFNVYYKQPHQWSEGERQFVEILANQIAITIENALNYRVTLRHKEEMRWQIDKLLDLQRVIQVINLEIYESLEQATENIRAYIAEKFNGRAIGIFQAGADNTLKLVASSGVSKKYETRFYDRSPHGSTLIDLAFLKHIVYTSSRVLTDERIDKQWSTFLSTEGFIATSALPLVVHERVIGVLAVHYSGLHVFSEDELSSLATLSQFVAASLENITNIQSLITEKEKTKAMVNSLYDGLIVYDTEGVVMEVNPRVEELLLVKRNDVVGKHPRNLAPHQTMLASVRTVSMAPLADFESKEILIDEPLNIALRITQVPLYDEGEKNIGSMRILHDITEARAVEKLKSNFVTTASHQMRTPLTGIKWGLDSLLKSSDRLSDEERNLLEQMSKSNEYVIRLVNDLLDVSRMEEGRFYYQFEKGDFGALLLRLAFDFSAMAKSADIAFSLHLPSEPLPPIMMDEVKMDIALRNIIDNAVKYTLAGGFVDVSLDINEESVVLRIKDTGIGISKEDQKFLFNKFFRGKNAVRVKTEGTGLGLYISKNIIEQHNGTLRVESGEGTGTLFTIQLPTRDELMPEPAPR